MLQELQQTRETLAARDAEVQELKTRVAELEKLQQDQQQLISLKDGKLAETQQALAARQAEQTRQAPDGAVSFWPWAIGGLVIGLVLAWLWMRTRRKPTTIGRPLFDASRLAASVPQKPASAEPEPPAAPSPGAMPTWHSGPASSPAQPATEPAAAGFPPQPPVPASTPAAPSPAPAVAPSGESVDSSGPASSGHDRIELARAYVDLGDVDTARSLLQEVADSGDAAARGEASRLLRDLV